MHILYLRVSEKNSRRIRNYKIHYSEKVYRDIPAFQTFEIVHMHTRIFPALTEFASLPRARGTSGTCCFPWTSFTAVHFKWRYLATKWIVGIARSSPPATSPPLDYHGVLYE
jgi:hypothetical protein